MHSQTHPDPRAYVLPIGFHLQGPLDLGVLARAFNRLVQRHEALRTGFMLRESGPAQVVVAHSVCPFVVESSPTPGQEATRRWVVDAMTAGFALDKPPLIRVHVRRHSDDRSDMLVLVHHLVFDGWSVALLVSEISAAYRAIVEGTTIPEPPATTCRPHVKRESELTCSPQGERNSRYWTDVLRRHVVHPPWLASRQRATGKGRSLELRLGEHPSAEVRRMADELDTTEFVVFAALLVVVLSKFTDDDRVVLGYPVTARDISEEGTIGLFITTLALSIAVPGSCTFRDVVAEIEEEHFGGLEHRPMEVDRVLAAAPRVRSVGHPVFDVILAFQNVPKAVLDIPGMRAEPLRVMERAAEFGLSITVEGTTPVVTGRIDADSTVPQDVVDRFVQGLATTAVMAGRDVDEPVGEWAVLGEPDWSLLARLNDTVVPVPALCLHELVERGARRDPTAVAIEHGDSRMTNGDLNQRVNRLAAQLSTAEIGPGDLVGVCVPRTPRLVVALLAVLKAGAAYVPFDPLHPPARLRSMVAESGIALMLGEVGSADWLPEVGPPVWYIDIDGPDVAVDMSTPVAPVAPGDLAYVIYTSGSTGRPKGVMVTHAAIANLMVAMDRAVGCRSGDTFCAITSVAFDIAVVELFWPLTVGARVLLADRADPPSPTIPVTHLQSTPTVLRLLLDDPEWRAVLGGLRFLLVGGEPVPSRLVDAIRSGSDCQVFNAYGPTETTVWSAVREITDSEDAGLIGKPVANTTFHILDAAGRQVPVGVPGELHIGGAGLARGYLNLPELTAETFAINPAGDRLYRTGDVVSVRPSGSLRFHGRIDDQVKVRGHRVEPAEVEAILADYPTVAAAAVTSHPDQYDQPRLTAYVVARTTDPGLGANLRRQLRAQLPEALVPSAVVVVDALPMTPNGKLDRRALPPPAPTRKADLSPRPGRLITEREAAVATIWRQVLRLDRVDADDNFLDLGGDSLAAIRVAAEARTQGLRLSASAVLRAESLAALAEQATDTPNTRARAVQPASVDVPLLPLQHSFFERRRPDSNWANVAGLYLLPHSRLDLGRLRDALTAVTNRHEALRARFRRVSDHWVQTVSPQSAAALDIAPLDDPLSTGSPGGWLRTLDIASGPTLRLVAVPASHGPRIFLVAHHLVMDGWSWRVLLEDLAKAYASPEEFSANVSTATVAYSTWAAAVAEWAGSPAGAAETSYWSSLPLADVPPIPRDHLDGTNTARFAESVVRALDTRVTARIIGPALGRRRISAQEALLAAFAAAYRQWAGVALQSFRVLRHGRDAVPDVDATRTVGWLAADYPLVVETPTAAPRDVLSAVCEQMRSVPTNGNGYGALRYLSPGTGTQLALRAQPTPDVNFNYVGSQDATAPAGGWTPVPADLVGRFSPDESRGSVLQVRAAVHGRGMLLDVQYSRDIHRRATIEALADQFVRAIHGILAETASSPAQGS